MFTNKKHIRRIAAGLLLFYSFFLLLAAFHTHKPRSQSVVDCQGLQLQSDNRDVDHFLDEDSNCQLCQFSSIKIVLSQQLDLESFLPQESSQPQIISSSHILSGHYFNTSLRAPPSFS
jgi:hypothetical protein